MRHDERLLTPREVGAMLRVDPKTVTRWVEQGKLRSIRTPGGQHRFREGDIDQIIEGHID